MTLKVLWGITIPFIGTLIGSSVVFLLKKEISQRGKNIFSALASGIMLAASVWSLLLPALEMSDGSILHTATGFLVGVISMIWTDKIIEKRLYSDDINVPYARKTMMQLIAVTAHNIPEGMAVGMVFAALLNGNSDESLMPAFVLSLGIAIQNIPEGAIVTMPVMAEKKSKARAFLWGFVSGVVEPLGAILSIVLARYMAEVLPFFLSFAAGAMIYVVVEQLIPEMYIKESAKGKITTIFSLGFLLMMSLDVLFG